MIYTCSSAKFNKLGGSERGGCLCVGRNVLLFIHGNGIVAPWERWIFLGLCYFSSVLFIAQSTEFLYDHTVLGMGPVAVP